MAARKKPAAGNQNYGVDYASFAESMMDTSLYGVGAYFCDQHPELVDDVLNESDSIESIGLQAYAAANGLEGEALLRIESSGISVSGI